MRWHRGADLGRRSEGSKASDEAPKRRWRFSGRPSACRRPGPQEVWTWAPGRLGMASVCRRLSLVRVQVQIRLENDCHFIVTSFGATKKTGWGRTDTVEQLSIWTVSCGCSCNIWNYRPTTRKKCCPHKGSCMASSFCPQVSSPDGQLFQLVMFGNAVFEDMFLLCCGWVGGWVGGWLPVVLMGNQRDSNQRTCYLLWTVGGLRAR